MNKGLHFSRSPLTEALIDIRIQSRPDLNLDDLAAIQKGHESEYPSRKDQMLVEGQFSIDPDNPVAIGNRTHIGYEFKANDERQTVRVSVQGFSFSRIAPYDTWETFRDEARRWWRIYSDVAQPISPTRLAVRYINRLDLPLPLQDFKDYLRTVPEVSADLPQELAGYFMQLQIPYYDIGANLLLNQGIVPAPRPNMVSIVLDIDLFRIIDVPLGEEEVWDYFEHLRIKKNDIFLACITDKTKELIA